ncbi:hypothetical protein EFER_0438 [Escherichia fergusonii ATCC 35469]|uniref:Uncharacterized protein n=1 Tax=Escherichia fergusonii (strain ATCC 35469 / DSM 13698 / CCUG 18766 / IAM 14443 / JCM 21226 / LMG 7866 / NBRC 102419 / NCTC 12128 / CDC 0568-73) TaxID=585054 RepID=B7LUU0_ESCF3|nr:hypothetical protein EFER_0438 [Escherichia fergusonii ATCC 35469]
MSGPTKRTIVFIGSKSMETTHGNDAPLEHQKKQREIPMRPIPTLSVSCRA